MQLAAVGLTDLARHPVPWCVANCRSLHNFHWIVNRNLAGWEVSEVQAPSWIVEEVTKITVEVLVARAAGQHEVTAYTLQTKLFGTEDGFQDS